MTMNNSGTIIYHTGNSKDPIATATGYINECQLFGFRWLRVRGEGPELLIPFSRVIRIHLHAVN